MSEWRSRLKTDVEMITINDSWTDWFKKEFIKEMKQKKKNGERVTEKDMETARLFELSLEDLFYYDVDDI